MSGDRPNLWEWLRDQDELAAWQRKIVERLFMPGAAPPWSFAVASRRSGKAETNRRLIVATVMTYGACHCAAPDGLWHVELSNLGGELLWIRLPRVEPDPSYPALSDESFGFQEGTDT